MATVQAPRTPVRSTSQASHTSLARFGSSRPHDVQVRDGPRTRQAMVASAMAGINRFKQSWISIMVLKASIGLGQVITLVTLLILASVLNSPLYPRLQSVPSESCPRPQLFQAWMALNVCRLTICWGVSCWTCVRFQRARRSEERARAEEERRIDVSDTRNGISPSTSVSSIQPTPSLGYSAASSSSAALSAMSNSPYTTQTPDTRNPSSIRSSLSLDTSCPDAFAKSPRTLDMRHAGTKEEDSAPVNTGTVAEFPATYVMGQAAAAVDNDVRVDEIGSHASMAMSAGSRDGIEEDEVPGAFAAWLDRWSMSISKGLGVISAGLFLLGNILVFYPLPASRTTCYHAAPLLWWGVMSVTGVGWFLLGQVFFLGVVVGIGGQAVLALLRRIGMFPDPPEPAPPRPPQPEPLTPDDLFRLKLVIFVPRPDSSPPPTRSCSPGRSHPLVVDIPSTPGHLDSSVSTVDISRLQYPPIYLPSHQSTCAICQESFTPPIQASTIMLKAEPLRLLGCGHVYHVECIDQWLLQGSGNCPFCNRSIRDMWCEKEINSTGPSPNTRRANRRLRRTR